MTGESTNKQKKLNRTMVILLAIASLGTTALLALLVINQKDTNDAPAQLLGGTFDNDPLPKIKQLPDFSFTDQRNQPFNSETLKGKVWVAHFFFIDCSSICPMTSAHMMSLQNDLEKRDLLGDAQLVSFSVNPEADTPDRLSEYANDFQADAKNWHWLTGQREPMRQLIRESFMLIVEDAPDNLAMPINHSSKLALVDKAGHIRGYYDVLTPEMSQYDLLIADIQTLLKEPN